MAEPVIRRYPKSRYIPSTYFEWLLVTSHQLLPDFLMDIAIDIGDFIRLHLLLNNWIWISRESWGKENPQIILQMDSLSNDEFNFWLLLLKYRLIVGSKFYAMFNGKYIVKNPWKELETHKNSSSVPVAFRCSFNSDLLTFWWYLSPVPMHC